MSKIRRSLVIPTVLLLVGAPLRVDAGQESADVEITAVRDLSSAVSPLEQTAHLDVHDVTMEEALTALQASAGLPVAYSPTLLPRTRLVTCRCSAASIEVALNTILWGTALEFTVLGDQVVIRRAKGPVVGWPNDLLTTGLAALPALESSKEDDLVLLPAIPREGTITGRVVGSGTQRPLAGAQISLPALGIGALANNDGRFQITGVPAGETTLRVQMIGYATQDRTVTVSSGQTLVQDFELTRQALGLDEIVVTGTAGGVQRRAVGNVVGSLDVESQLEFSAPADMQQLLSGQVSGVNVDLGGGNVGSGGSITIRGMSTEALNSHPLVYVDGIRVQGGQAGGVAGSQISRLNDLNPNDIERIEIIKGPAAATLYGTEASNGVIQIITKKGRAGVTTFDFTMQQGANWFHDPENRTPTLHNLTPENEIVSINLVREENQAGRPVFRTGHVQSYGLSLRGGQDRLTYYMSGNHEVEQGFQFNNEMTRSTVRANLQLALMESLDISTEVGAIKSEGLFVSDGQAGGFGAINLIFGGDPLLRDTHFRGFGTGPPEVFRALDNRENLHRAIVSSTVNHRPLPWLTQRLTGGVDWTDANRSEFIPRLPEGSHPYFAANSVGRKQLQHRRDLNYTADYNVTASFDLSPGWTSATSLGAQYAAREGLVATATGTNMPTPVVSTVSAAAVRTGAETYVENKTFGLFVQQTFGWQDQAFLTAAIRADANSAFGENFNAAYYPKVSATWVVSDADFWRFDAIESLRVRSAWGQSGLQPDAFAATRTYSPTTGPNDLPTVTPGNIGNPDLKPEVGEELEVGFDVGFLGDRIDLEFTHYRQRTTDMIVQELVAPSGGFSGARYVNIGEVQNRGYEVGLRTRPLVRESVDLSIHVAASKNNNLLVDLGGREVQADTRGRWQHVEGYELGSMWTKHIASAEWGPDGELVNVTCRGPEEEDFRPMPCAEAPFHYWGNPAPTWIGSTSQTLTFPGLGVTLSSMWVFQRHGWRFLTSLGDGINGRTMNSMHLRLGTLDPIAAANILTPDVEHNHYQRTDFLRLRDITASYNLPERWVGGLGVSRASLSVSGRNLVTFTHRTLSKDRLPDPETSAARSTPWPGWQQTRVPRAHSIVTTMRVTF